ncbi:hypothetical protein GCM10023405_22220 [Streptomonospora salina]
MFGTPNYYHRRGASTPVRPAYAYPRPAGECGRRRGAGMRGVRPQASPSAAAPRSSTKPSITQGIVSGLGVEIAMDSSGAS